MGGLINDPECPKAGKHRELEASEIKKRRKLCSELCSEHSLQSRTSLTHLPSLTKDQLYNVASGAPVSPEVEIDVLRADTACKEAAFIRDRFQNRSSEEAFFEPLKQLKTMEASNRTVKVTSSEGKLIQYLEQSNLAFMLLFKSQLLDEPLNLDELMRYSFSPVLPALHPRRFLCQNEQSHRCISCWLTPPRRFPIQEMRSTSRMV